MPIIDSQNLPREITDKYSVVNNSFKLDKIKNAELDVYTGDPKDEINVIVGDDKQPDKYYPQVKLQRFSNEVNFSVRLINNEVGEETVKTEADKIVWEKGNIKIENYEADDAYKFVWYLKEKPATNKVEFTIQSKGLDFFYQPELTQAEIDAGAFRPENVVGSYAVYHSTKGGMVDKDGKDYKVGKAFHIYRPHIIDTEGKETWGNLHIENGIYSVEIPQEFLDSAVYPIKSNDTFGETGVGEKGVNLTNDLWHANKFTLSESGEVTKMTAYYSGTDAGIKCILYNDDSSYPGGLEGITNDQPAESGITWYDFTFSSNPTISAGDYWLGTIGKVTPSVYYDSSGGTRIYYNGLDSYYATPPDPFPSGGSASSRLFSVYATYTAGGTTTSTSSTTTSSSTSTSSTTTSSSTSTSSTTTSSSTSSTTTSSSTSSTTTSSSTSTSSTTTSSSTSSTTTSSSTSTSSTTTSSSTSSTTTSSSTSSTTTSSSTSTSSTTTSSSTSSTTTSSSTSSTTTTTTTSSSTSTSSTTTSSSTSSTTTSSSTSTSSTTTSSSTSSTTTSSSTSSTTTSSSTSTSSTTTSSSTSSTTTSSSTSTSSTTTSSSTSSTTTSSSTSTTTTSSSTSTSTSTSSTTTSSSTTNTETTTSTSSTTTSSSTTSSTSTSTTTTSSSTSSSTSTTTTSSSTSTSSTTTSSSTSTSTSTTTTSSSTSSSTTSTTSTTTTSSSTSSTTTSSSTTSSTTSSTSTTITTTSSSTTTTTTALDDLYIRAKKVY